MYTSLLKCDQYNSYIERGSFFQRYSSSPASFKSSHLTALQLVHCNYKSRNDEVKLRSLYTVDVTDQRKGYWRDSLIENVYFFKPFHSTFKYHTLKLFLQFMQTDNKQSCEETKFVSTAAFISSLLATGWNSKSYSSRTRYSWSILIHEVSIPLLSIIQYCLQTLIKK